VKSPIVGLLVLMSAVTLYAEDNCADPQTQLDMNLCQQKAFEKADAELNGIYKQVVAQLDVTGKGLLKEAQRSWIKFRDQECKFEAFKYEGGSMQPLIVSGCLTELTRQRVESLKKSKLALDEEG